MSSHCTRKSPLFKEWSILPSPVTASIARAETSFKNLASSPILNEEIFVQCLLKSHFQSQTICTFPQAVMLGGFLMYFFQTADHHACFSTIWQMLMNYKSKPRLAQNWGKSLVCFSFLLNLLFCTTPCPTPSSLQSLSLEWLSEIISSKASGRR